MTRRVLVADDSATIQKVIKIAFSRHELEIVEAASLIESLASVTREKVDALILDASLPGANGPDDFVKLKEEAGGAPVLLLVGTYDSVDEQAFRVAGFENFLKKPFESTDIVTTLDAMLGAGPMAALETTPPPPLGRPKHPTMILSSGTSSAFQPSKEVTGSFRLSEDDAPEGEPPPPPVLDQTRKGRRAFAEGEDTMPSRAGGGSDEATDPRRSAAKNPLPPIPSGAGLGGHGTGAALTAAGDEPSFKLQERPAPPARRPMAISRDDAQAAMDADLPALVRQAVEDYCERHFKSLAREVIATELRRLADEKARHLVDN